MNMKTSYDNSDNDLAFQLLYSLSSTGAMKEGDKEDLEKVRKSVLSSK